MPDSLDPPGSSGSGRLRFTMLDFENSPTATGYEQYHAHVIIDSMMPTTFITVNNPHQTAARNEETNHVGGSRPTWTLANAISYVLDLISHNPLASMLLTAIRAHEAASAVEKKPTYDSRIVQYNYQGRVWWGFSVV